MTLLSRNSHIKTTFNGKISGTRSHYQGGKVSKIAVQQVGGGRASVIGYKLTGIRANEPNQNPFYVYDRHYKKITNFINTLYRDGARITYCLRTMVRPFVEKGQFGDIQIALLVKTEERSKSAIDRLAESIRLLLGGVFKNHRWDMIEDSAELEGFINPLEWEQSSHVEFKRRLEKIQLDSFLPERAVGFLERAIAEGESAETIDYIHPYTLAQGAYERLFKTFLNGKQEVVWSTILSPTKLSPDENEFLYKQISLCEGKGLPTGEVMSVPISRSRGLIETIMRGYLVLQDMPFYMNTILSTRYPLDASLIEYCGLALTEPIDIGKPRKDQVDLSSLNVGGYDISKPMGDAQQSSISNNLATLSQDDWETETPTVSNRFRHLFDANEAISSFYFPVNAEDNLPGVELYTLNEQSLPRELVELAHSKRKKILIGENRFFGFDQSVFISEDTRRQHAYIVGQTGTGKTTLMKTMISSDMEAGNGIAVIDPHGEFFNDILSIIPLSRKDDVVLIDPADFDYPVGMNLMEVSGDEERDYVVKELRAIFKRYIREYYDITDGGYLGPVFFQHVQNNLLLAMSDIDNPGTIIEFFNIFMDTDFWNRWLPLKWTNPQLSNWTNEVLTNTNYNAVNRSDGSRYGDYFASKFMDFVNDSRVSNIFGQPRSTINIAEAVRNNKIILINLSKGMLGEANSTLLGMILLAKISATLMARAKEITLGKKITPFYLYVDEFQNIASENFSILLAEARKFGLGLVLANQYLTQISDRKILNSILGNVGTMISFRLGLEDSQLLESQFLPTFSKNDLANLPNYHAVMRTNVDGERLVPSIFKTIRPEITPNVASPEEIRKGAREKFGTPKVLAEEIVKYSLAPKRAFMYAFDEDRIKILKEYDWNNVDLSVLKAYWDHDEKLNELASACIQDTFQSIFTYLTSKSELENNKTSPILAKIKGQSSPDFYLKQGKIEDILKGLASQETCEVIDWMKNTGKVTFLVNWLERSANRGNSKQQAVLSTIERYKRRGERVKYFSTLRDLDIPGFTDSWLDPVNNASRFRTDEESDTFF